MLTLPERKHLVHKPVELRNLSKKLQESVNPLSDDYIREVKYDGCHMIVIVADGKAYGYSREGNEVQSCNHILRELQTVSNNAVFFGEAWDFRKEHAEISGDFRRFSPSLSLQYIVFDMIPLADFMAGQCQVPFETRRRWLTDLLYLHDDKLDNVLQAELDNDNHIEFMRGEGFPAVTDGYVAKRKDGLWVAGAGKGGEQIKLKNHVSLDLRCVGEEMGQGKFAGMIGSLTCEYNGGIISVGGGKMTDDDRRNRGYYVGKIVEVHALCGSQHGLLREPRFIRVRHDKTEPSE